ncbi:MAG: hypothetical protein ACT4PV_12555 [Planctomycetaceae bacterium]
MRQAALLLLFCSAALAQGEEPLFQASEWITAENCTPLAKEVMPGIEAYTRMGFRRPVPLRVMPRAAWEEAKAQEGFVGHAAGAAVAFYTPALNTVTMVPWQFDDPNNKRTAAAWRSFVEPTLIHELVHAIHHQNFFSEGRFYMASLKATGLTDEEIDRSTVDFLLSEGVAELVALRTTTELGGMFRQPARETDPPRRYMRSYQPDPEGKKAFRILLFESGYQDGLTLMHHIAMRGGMRAIRAILYRPPHRALLFQPDLLATVDFDDPPEPDAIFGCLHPGALDAEGIFLAVNPGAGRFFESASRGRDFGCLIGYTTKATEGANGGGNYSFFVADPARPGDWSSKQAQSLRELAAGKAQEKEVALPLLDGVKASLIAVPLEGERFHLRAESVGLVIHMEEAQRSPRAEERILAALRALTIKRPKTGVYDEALKAALAALEKAGESEGEGG